MAERQKKPTGGGKLSRSEVITVRLDPKLRFGADLAARKQRRTLSSFVEWAVEKALEEVEVDISTSGEVHAKTVNAAAALDSIWDVEDADRFAKMAFRAPELLNYEEQIIWKHICECGAFWFGDWRRQGELEFYRYEISETNFIPFALKTHWNKYASFIKGELSEKELPKFETVRQVESSKE